MEAPKVVDSQIMETVGDMADVVGQIAQTTPEQWEEIRLALRRILVEHHNYLREQGVLSI